MLIHGRGKIRPVAPHDDEAGRRRLGAALAAYLRQTEGRGAHCHVDAYLRGDRHYFFAYPEDYGATHLEYEGEHLQRRTARPAFEIIFVDRREEGAY